MKKPPRPIFASVLSIVMLVVGGIAYTQLPVSQYPEIAPPTIVVQAVYPGADAETVAATVATPLEQEVNGVENMLYMSSNSSSEGRVSITVTFQNGTNIDIAQVDVQNRIQSVLPQLPQEVLPEPVLLPEVRRHRRRVHRRLRRPYLLKRCSDRRRVRAER